MPAFTFLNRKYKYLQEENDLDYSKGYTTYLANDVVPANQLVYATDTRISTLGRMQTRKGCDFYSVPAGEAQDQAVTSATGAALKQLSTSMWLAQKVTAGANGRLTMAELELSNTASGTGPIIVELRSDTSGPGALLAQSSVPAASLSSSLTYLSARFIEAPQVVSGTSYWLVAHIQDDGSNSYNWNSTTAAITAQVSSNFGQTWTTTSYAMHFKTFVATDSPLLGHFRAYKSDGTKVTLVAYKESGGTTAVATVNDGTGALTPIKTGLSSSASRYEFTIMNDLVIYVNGVDVPRKWDFTTEAALGGSPSAAKDLIVYKNQLFLVSATNPTRLDFSNVSDPETWTGTNFLYVPAPLSPDPITKLANLNDNLWIFTAGTKWQLTGSDITNMVLRQSPATKGCAAPRTVHVTLTFIYFASDDNVYRFNGTADTPLFTNVLPDYLGAATQSTLAGAVWNNRYYLWYTPPGGNENSRCFVYNVNFNSMESDDLAAWISSAEIWNTVEDEGQFLQASSVVGALYFGELAANSYNNLGRQPSWELRSAYDHMGQPGTKKHIKRWYPRFAAVQGNYSVACAFDVDFAGAPTVQLLPLQGAGFILGSLTPTLGNFILGTTSLIAPHMTIGGEFRYLQVRYSRTGVNNPVEFYGSSFYYYIRRPR